ncbi:MAG: hypothetical protein Q9164_000411 [Protoblastenia rupestris]
MRRIHELDKRRKEPQNAMRKVNRESIGLFEFMKLPGEIKNKIYADLLNPDRHFHELTGRQSDFIETSVLCLNKAINFEASTIWSNTIVTISISFTDFDYCQPALHILAGASRFRRLVVDIRLADQSLHVLEPSSQTFPPGKTESLLEFVHRLSVQLSRLPCLQELTIRSYGVDTHLLRQNTAPPCSIIWPDTYLRCLHVIKGLHKAKVEGAVKKGLATQLERSMMKPKQDANTVFTLDALFEELVQSRCLCMKLEAGRPAVWVGQYEQ